MTNDGGKGGKTPMDRTDAQVMMAYRCKDAPTFTAWYEETRDGSDGGEVAYQAELREAKTWWKGYCEGAEDALRKFTTKTRLYRHGKLPPSDLFIGSSGAD